MTRGLRCAVVAAPFAGLAGLVFFREPVLQMARRFPVCLFHALLGWMCPGCGNTRSVMSLLRGDLSASLRYNITPVVLGTLLFLLYLETAFYAFGHPRRLLPRSGKIWFPFLGAMLLYYLLRNFIPALIV